MREPRLRPRLRRVLAGFVLAVAAVGITASPASAHTVGGVDATNYRTRVLSVSPAVEGVRARVVENGNRLAVTNHSPRDVVVVGYDDEPYLRVGRRGAFENVRSPATYLNRTMRPTEAPPASADPSAPPEWRRIGAGPTVRWHDHRAHWMGTAPPPAVARDPGRARLVQNFAIVLRSEGRDIRVRGDVWWVPGPSPWPWVAFAIMLAVGVVVAARTRYAAAVTGSVLAVALVAAIVHAVGSWSSVTSSTASRLSDVLPTLAAVALGGLALVRLVRRGLAAAAPLLVFAGLFLAIAIGLADFAAFTHSQVPTELPSGLDRLTIAVALGGGAGVSAGAAFHVADGARPRRRGGVAVRDSK